MPQDFRRIHHLTPDESTLILAFRLLGKHEKIAIQDLIRSQAALAEHASDVVNVVEMQHRRTK